MRMRTAIFFVAAAFVASTALAAGTALNAVLYPEGKEIKLKFQTTERAPKATLTGSVRPQQGQSRIEISWKKLEPALLFGGRGVEPPRERAASIIPCGAPRTCRIDS